MTPTAPHTLELLRRHQLRVTDARQDVLRCFMTQGYAMSHAELETQLPTYDRVTLYRTLSTFEEKGLVHRVLDDSGAMKYALCAEACTDHHHADDHVHFKCLQCGRTECLEGVHLPQFAIPSGYSVSQQNVLLQGLCPRCVS